MELCLPAAVASGENINFFPRALTLTDFMTTSLVFANSANICYCWWAVTWTCNFSTIGSVYQPSCNKQNSTTFLTEQWTHMHIHNLSISKNNINRPHDMKSTLKLKINWDTQIDVAYLQTVHVGLYRGTKCTFLEILNQCTVFMGLWNATFYFSVWPCLLPARINLT